MGGKKKRKSSKKSSRQSPKEKIINKEPPKVGLERIKEIYIKDYKKLFLIPIILFLLSSLLLFNNYRTTGDFITRDVSLKGGISITINVNQDYPNLETQLNNAFNDASFNIRTIESKGVTSGLIIEATDIEEDSLIDEISKTITLTKENYSVESMGSSLGESFFRQMFIAVLLAFISMGLVFQLYFRNIYATLAALFSAFMDIFITLGIMDLFGLKLTAGGIAAYLMLIGYSIDTSILLSTKLLKESTDKIKGLFGAMKTGFTMSAAGIAATGVSFLFTNNITLKQIMLILIVGLFVDLITTWIGNVGFLRFYLEKNKK